MKSKHGSEIGTQDDGILIGVARTIGSTLGTVAATSNAMSEAARRLAQTGSTRRPKKRISTRKQSTAKKARRGAIRLRVVAAKTKKSRSKR